MSNDTMTPAAIDALLHNAETGRLGTIGSDGHPYIVPLHFIVLDDCIYLHGKTTGTKLSNIAADNRVAFVVDHMVSLVQGKSPCNTSTAYQSIFIKGTASIVTDKKIACTVLEAFIKKYAAQHENPVFPEGMLTRTAVVKVTILEKTGKQHNMP